MNLVDGLTLERYKLVTDRQKYFTELARDSFSSYMKIFAGLVVGGITLISARAKLELEPNLLLPILDAIVYLVTFLGIVAIGQIIFCLARWLGYRQAEMQVNPASPRIGRWWWIFETLYCVAIVASIVAVWIVSAHLSAIIVELAG